MDGDGDDRWLGSGQRVLATDAGDYDLMAVRTIEFDEVPAADRHLRRGTA